MNKEAAQIRWLEPEPCAANDSEHVLTLAQVERWREQGFALVDGVIPSELLEAAIEDARAAYPAAGTPESESIVDFGSGGHMVFPFHSSAANDITLHPRLLRSVAELLGSRIRDLRLTQSDLWPKYGRHSSPEHPAENDDQRIHVDYPNHTLTHPPRWNAPEAVEIILYLTDISECDGATALVPRDGRDDPAYPWPIVETPGVGDLVWINDRTTAEAHLANTAPEIAEWRAQHLYPRECQVRFHSGTLLFYRHDTWHRGTPLRPGTCRLAQNLTFRLSTSEWVSTLHSGWAWGMYRPSQSTERMVARASIDQRCVLGFPPPGHPYWTQETVEAVNARYAPLGFDATPYAEALPPPSHRHR
ncbi:phytanoyl-CoA dioxygenase family protein [Myxococcota bacterium]|nr:phytanoyl-CoA dioxygenase family protein [Myxococcota bacterium]